MKALKKVLKWTVKNENVCPILAYFYFYSGNGYQHKTSQNEGNVEDSGWSNDEKNPAKR